MQFNTKKIIPDSQNRIKDIKSNTILTLIAGLLCTRMHHFTLFYQKCSASHWGSKGWQEL